MRQMCGSDEMPYYTTKAVRGPMTKINQSNRSIAGPIFPSIGPGIVPNDPVLCPALNFKSRWRTMQVFFRRCFWCMLTFKRAKESCPIIQWGKPASIDCLTPIFPKTTWWSLGSTKIFSAYKLASFSHHATSDVRFTQQNQETSQQLEAPAMQIFMVSTITSTLASVFKIQNVVTSVVSCSGYSSSSYALEAVSAARLSWC